MSSTTLDSETSGPPIDPSSRLTSLPDSLIHRILATAGAAGRGAYCSCRALRGAWLSALAYPPLAARYLCSQSNAREVARCLGFADRGRGLLRHLAATSAHKRLASPGTIPGKPTAQGDAHALASARTEAPSLAAGSTAPSSPPPGGGTHDDDSEGTARRGGTVLLLLRSLAALGCPLSPYSGHLLWAAASEGRAELAWAVLHLEPQRSPTLVPASAPADSTSIAGRFALVSSHAAPHPIHSLCPYGNGSTAGSNPYGVAGSVAAAAALEQALRKGHLAVAFALLAAGCDPAACPQRAAAALTAAAVSGSGDAVRLVVRHGVDARRHGYDALCAAFAAAQRGGAGGGDGVSERRSAGGAAVAPTSSDDGAAARPSAPTHSASSAASAPTTPATANSSIAPAVAALVAAGGAHCGGDAGRQGVLLALACYCGSEDLAAGLVAAGLDVARLRGAALLRAAEAGGHGGVAALLRRAGLRE